MNADPGAGGPSNDALTQVFLATWQWLFLIAFRALGSSADAEDAVMAAWEKAMGEIRREKYRSQGKFEAWIRCILQNKIVDEVRRRGRWRAVEAADGSGSFLDRLPASDQPGDESLMENEPVDEIRRALEFLDEMSVLYLLLCYWSQGAGMAKGEAAFWSGGDGMSVEEIAALFAESPTTVKGRLQVARRRLRKIMDKLGKLRRMPRDLQLTALSPLGDAHVRAWDLFFWSGESVKDVGRKIGLPRTEVVSHLRAAFLKL